MPQPIQKTPSRRWLTFRISTLLLAVGLVSIALGYPHLRHYVQFQRFKSFAGRDLSQLSDEERETLGTITRELHEELNQIWDNRNWLVAEVASAHRKRYLLLQGSVFYCTDVDCIVLPYLFSSTGELISHTPVNLGYEITLEDASVVSNPVFPEITILRLDTCPMIHLSSTPVRQQYYGIIGDEMVLLRLEDSEGNFRNNFYRVGPEPTQRTETQWLSGLRDPNPIEVLRSLNWLADADSPVDSAETVAIVKQLSTHQNAWIAEAAQYVLSPHPDHRSDLFQLLRDDTSHAN